MTAFRAEWCEVQITGCFFFQVRFSIKCCNKLIVKDFDLRSKILYRQYCFKLAVDFWKPSASVVCLICCHHPSLAEVQFSFLGYQCKRIGTGAAPRLQLVHLDWVSSALFVFPSTSHATGILMWALRYLELISPTYSEPVHTLISHQ